MIVNTTRFGSIRLSDEDLLTFPEGLLGFGDLRSFVLLDDPNDDIFAWLQSCDDPDIAFPVLEPELFEENYSIHMVKSDLAGLQVSDELKLRSFCVVTIPEDPTRMTANLKAPVVVNTEKRLAKQCVLQNPQLEIREPIFAKLQRRVVSHNPGAIKSQVSNWDVTVRLEKVNPDPEVGL